jgi:hypothetical protein
MAIILRTPKPHTDRFIGFIIAIIPEKSSVIILIFSLPLIKLRLDPVTYHVIIEDTP